MLEDDYNDSPARIELIPAGTTLYRITDLASEYEPNSFNCRNIKPLGHERQGRFDPVDDSHGGYLYVATSPTGVVAEGVLRGRDIPRSGFVRRSWLLQKSLSVMRLETDVKVAQIYGPSVRLLNLDASVCTCKRYSYPNPDNRKNRIDNYTTSRTIGHRIISNTPEAAGLRYTCRNNDAVQSLLLTSRYGQPDITVLEQLEILGNEEATKLVIETLAEYGLHYMGEIPGQRS